MEDSVVPYIGDSPWALLACGIYFLLLVIIGIWSARFSSKGQEHFLLGGRKMKSIVVGLSAVVSGRSAWLLLSVSGLAFVRGASAIWFVAGYTIAELLMFLTMAKRLRKDTEASGDLTIPDYFISRFGDRAHLLRAVTSSIIIIFMVTYVGAQIKAGGKALVAGFNLPEWQGVLITGAVVLLYTAVGGFLAVSLTDVLQAFMMIFALVALPIMAISHHGGLESIIGALSPQMIDPFAISIGVFLGAVGIGFGSPGNPHILVRFMSIEHERKLSTAGFVGFFWNVVMGIGAVSIGIIGRATYTLDQLKGADREMIFPTLAGLLPPFLFGLVIAAVFAAIMSTADSQLLVAASAAVRDFYQGIIRKNQDLDEKQLVIMNRVMVIVLCAIGIFIALFASEYVNFLVLLAWTGLGCSFGPPIILGLYWKKTSRMGAIAGLSAGTLTTFIWGLNPVLKGIVHEVVPAFIASFLATVAFSLIYNPSEKWPESQQWPSE